MTQPPQISPLERIADLLEASDRDRLLCLATRLKSLPYDDEILLIVESIGFMTLLWKTVPEEIQRILEGANPVPETCANLSRIIQDSINQAIPSQQDLRTVAQSLREHETALRNLRRGESTKKAGTSGHWLLIALLAASVIALLGERLAFFQLQL